jgi:tRNA-splicing ligase RtcB (3'-phosphate/5'-hydroxy nucleic acid ligase)
MCKAEMPIGDKSIKFWTDIETVEKAAMGQLIRTVSLPWVHKHVAVMPDVHLGTGATVGSVVPMIGAVSPACVGVDIGCGMGAIKTNLKAEDLPDSLRQLRLRIEELIPVGPNGHDTPVLKKSQRQLFDEFDQLDSHVQHRQERALSQVGTLGGGNHFIELCLDTEGNVWMMLHSGSRNIGKELAEIHIETAKGLAHNQDIVDRDLAVFLSGTPEMEAYRRDLYWAQRYAMLNRQTMFELYKKAMTEFFPNVEFEKPIMCHHNYVAEEHHFGEEVFVTRKGAISAKEGEMGIIPGSMGTKSYIVRGKGNTDSFTSASHGAGRVMSRGAAKRNITLAQFEEQTLGVECRKVAEFIDEAPGAYKNIDQVMANQTDLVEIVAELKQVLCVKG